MHNWNDPTTQLGGHIQTALLVHGQPFEFDWQWTSVRKHHLGIIPSCFIVLITLASIRSYTVIDQYYFIYASQLVVQIVRDPLNLVFIDCEYHYFCIIDYRHHWSRSNLFLVVLAIYSDPKHNQSFSVVGHSDPFARV